MLTLMRIIFIPIFVIVWYSPLENVNVICSFIFMIAAITDFVDGYLARKLNVSSKLGAFLDPVADKLMVTVVIVLLVEKDPRMAMSIPAMIIIGREVFISALREWMAENGVRGVVSVSWLGKFKAFGQMGAMWLLIYHDNIFITIQDTIYCISVYQIALNLLYVALIYTIWSMVDYSWAAWKAMRTN